jgi:hypothetical protein
MILDYVRRSEDGSILIPPFHTGHLGFIPGTEVYVYLMSPFNVPESHCELFVTPFTPNIDTLCRLQCMMKDQPGVVNRLIEAVAALDINIVKKESSGVNYLKQHLVEMVLDWRTSQFNQFLRSPAEIISHYDQLQYRLPVMDYRYVRLYEEIMCECGDIIHLDNDFGITLPAISITPFIGGHVWNTPERVEIKAEAGRKYYVKFSIPPALFKQICRSTQHGDTEPLPYIINSETTSRSLRVFFPKKAVEPRILHVAFLHVDMPGALSVITKVLAEAGFNILTGLLRKKTPVYSGYEVVLEYIKVDDTPPPIREGEGYEAQYEWVKSKIESCAGGDVHKLSSFEVSIAPPEYPKLRRLQNFKPLPLGRDCPPTASAPAVGSREEIARARLLQCIERTLQQPLPRPELEESRVELLKAVESRLNQRKKIIFLSYPTIAQMHAARLRAQMEAELPDEFEITDYQTTDFAVVVDRVIERIKESDYFIGIWHHEQKIVTPNAEPTISPWMPFEYGIALAMGKKAIVIHSDMLPDTIWKRIRPEISHPSYNDLTFLELTVPGVIDYCRMFWMQPGNGSSEIL